MQALNPLTPYPVGSKREFWALSWPLMLGLISSTLMTFADRLFLAHFDTFALNAAANAGMAYYMFLIIPMGIASISEVLVGRLNGEGKYKEIGSAAWQMIWFSIILTPIFLYVGLGESVANCLFMGTGNETYEKEYFQTLLLFAPIQCVTIALSGFFIGLGKVRIVTVSALLGNFCNILFDYVAIFGWKSIPSMGVKGAALATGLSQIIQMLFLASLFFSRDFQRKYATRHSSLHKAYLYEGIKIGFPSGLGHCMEIIAHFLFFRIIMSSGLEQMAIVAMIQSLYIFFSFVIEAQSKAVSSIVANLLGAKSYHLFHKVLCSSFSLHGLYAALLCISSMLFPSFFFHLFSSTQPSHIVLGPNMLEIFSQALMYMSIFFLFDGLSWIFVGYLTASGDTKFIFVISTAVHWICYVIPALWFIGNNKGGADVAWQIIAMTSVITFMCYAWRYCTNAWLKNWVMTSST